MRRGGYNLLVMVPAQFGVNKRKIGGRAHLLSEMASLRRLCGWVNSLSFVRDRWMVPSFALSLQMLGQCQEKQGTRSDIRLDRRWAQAAASGLRPQALNFQSLSQPH